MNAKELAIYEPLWKAVPKMRPTGLRLAHIPTMTPDDSQFFYDGIPIPPALAAALCRVAAEDWLDTSLNFDGDRWEQWHLENGEAGWCVVMRRDEIEGPYSRWFEYGPTKHHALVAACIAVAGAQKSASASRAK